MIKRPSIEFNETIMSEEYSKYVHSFDETNNVKIYFFPEMAIRELLLIEMC